MTLDLITLVASFGFALAAYPFVIRALRRWKAGQVIQAELPESHQAKAGTPTAGGIVFVLLAVVAGVIAAIAAHPGALPGVAALVAGGLLGFADDRAKLQVGARGIPARLKLPLQVVLAIPVAALALQGAEPQFLLPSTPWLNAITSSAL